MHAVVEQFHVCSAVIVHVKYDDRGMFNLSRLAKELETAREYVAYIIADEASFLRFHFDGDKAAGTVRLSVSMFFICHLRKGRCFAYCHLETLLLFIDFMVAKLEITSFIYNVSNSTETEFALFELIINT